MVHYSLFLIHFKLPSRQPRDIAGFRTLAAALCWLQTLGLGLAGGGAATTFLP